MGQFKNIPTDGYTIENNKLLLDTNHLSLLKKYLQVSL